MNLKHPALYLPLAAAGMMLSGCETPEGNPDRTATGALVGGGVGAITGGLIGHSLDQQEQARLQAQAPETYRRIDQGQPLGIADVEALARAGIGDDVIISQIRASRTVYHLSAADIISLHDAGVSEKVINCMIDTPNAAGTTAAQAQTAVVEQPPPPPPAETILVAPGPGYVWIGGEWQWRGRWVWISGGWVRPPYPHAVWVRGRWDRGPSGWRHVPGHWR